MSWNRAMSDRKRELRRWKRRQRKQRINERRQKCRGPKFKGRNRHHIVNKCRGGSASVENLLLMWVQRHNAWHTLLKNDSFEDAIPKLERFIEVLKRTQRAKAAQAH